MFLLLRQTVVRSQLRRETQAKVHYLVTRLVVFFLSARKSTWYSLKARTIHLCLLLSPSSTPSYTTRLQSICFKTLISRRTSTLWSRTSLTWAPKPAYTYSRQGLWVVYWGYCSRTQSHLKKL